MTRRAIKEIARVVGEPEPGTSLYEALYPKRKRGDVESREETRPSKKGIEAIQWPPQIREPGMP